MESPPFLRIISNPRTWTTVQHRYPNVNTSSWSFLYKLTVPAPPHTHKFIHRHSQTTRSPFSCIFLWYYLSKQVNSLKTGTRSRIFAPFVASSSALDTKQLLGVDWLIDYWNHKGGQEKGAIALKQPCWGWKRMQLVFELEQERGQFGVELGTVWCIPWVQALGILCGWEGRNMKSPITIVLCLDLEDTAGQ